MKTNCNRVSGTKYLPIKILRRMRRPTIMGAEIETGFFNTQPFSPGDVKKVPAVSVRYWYWSFFERNLVGLADFAASNFQRMVHWPRFDLKSNWGSWPSVVISNRNWASWPSVVISSLHNRPIPLEPSRKLTNSSLRQQGIFFNVRGRKIL